MRLHALLVLTAILSAASAQAGVYAGSNGVQVGNISVGVSGISIPGYDLVDISGSSSQANDNATYNCTAKNPNASISGSNRTITVNGSCQTITVSGANNSVTAQQAKKLVESGANNDITITKVNNILLKGANSSAEYRSGLTVKRPTVNATGPNSSVDTF